MGTRSGDLDPAVLLYLLRERHLSAAAVGELVTRIGGLLGLSETTADMRELLEFELASRDSRAAEAIDVFCYQVKKAVGALAAALGGLDALIFTGGIGERAAPIRARVRDGLVWLGVRLDRDRNDEHAATISSPDAAVTVRVIPTNEELMIARHVTSIAAAAGAAPHS
jgi:acetate kinase